MPTISRDDIVGISYILKSMRIMRWGYSEIENSADASNLTSLPSITPPVSSVWLKLMPYFSLLIIPVTIIPVTWEPSMGFLLTPLNSTSNVSSLVIPLIVKSPTTLLSVIDFVSNVILSNSSVPKKSPDFKWLSRASF